MSASAAILLVKWGVYPVSLSCTTRDTQKIDLLSMKLFYFAGHGVYIEERLNLTGCVSLIVFASPRY